MTKNTFYKIFFTSLLLLIQNQAFAAAESKADPMDPPTIRRGVGKGTPVIKDARDAVYMSSPGGGTARLEDPVLDEGWRWCDDAMRVRIGTNYISFQATHEEMEALVKKVSKLWKSLQCSIKAKEDGRDIGFGNLAVAALTFIVDNDGEQTPITIPITTPAGGRLFFESGFRDTAECEASKAGKCLSPSKTLEAVLMALLESGATPDVLYTDLKELYEEAIGVLPVFPAPELLAKLHAKVDADKASWAKAESEGSIDFMHSEQILRLFLQNQSNLKHIFEQLKAKTSARSTITDAILHIHTRVDMCPVCSTTTSAAIDKNLANGIFPRIFGFMRSEGFRVKEEASTLLMVSSRDNPGRVEENPRRDILGMSVLSHVTPDRPIAAFHRHPDAASMKDPVAMKLGFESPERHTGAASSRKDMATSTSFTPPKASRGPAGGAGSTGIHPKSPARLIAGAGTAIVHPRSPLRPIAGAGDESTHLSKLLMTLAPDGIGATGEDTDAENPATTGTAVTYKAFEHTPPRLAANGSAAPSVASEGLIAPSSAGTSTTSSGLKVVA